MRHVQAREVVAVHLCLELRYRCINEQSWVGGTGTAPHDVWRASGVPRYYFINDALGLGWRGQVGAYLVEALGAGVQRSLL